MTVQPKEPFRPDALLNSLTVDLEDWHHVCGSGATAVVPGAEWRVAGNCRAVLRLFRDATVRGTFFVLGSVAEAEPGLLPMIAEEGHEIASHGWSHTLLNRLSREEFSCELERTEEVIRSQTGLRPIGFRAPQWSCSDRTPWVHEVLAERGYRYDSSCAPLPFVGNPSGRRYPYVVRTDGGEIWEVPPMVSATPFTPLPTAGGWGFRFFPMQLIISTIDKYNRKGCPAVLYLHPRDIDPDGPRLPLSALKSFASYGTRSDAAPRLSILMRRYRFAPLAEIVAEWQRSS